MVIAAFNGATLKDRQKHRSNSVFDFVILKYLILSMFVFTLSGS